MTQQTGRIFIISGPSGVGKGTLITGVQRKLPNVRIAVSATTRPARPDEIDGEDYYFFSDKQFEDTIDRGGFLEWCDVHGKRYGTLKSEIEHYRTAGKTILIEIDVQGAAKLKPVIEAKHIFIAPPNPDALEKRLFLRNTESPKNRKNRLETALKELKEMEKYDYVVVNDAIETAINDLLSIMAIPK